MDGFERAQVREPDDVAVYSAEEIWALVRHAKSLDDAAIFLLAALCGMRRSRSSGYGGGPCGEGADLLGRRFAGTAGELDELLGGPIDAGIATALAPTHDDVA